MGKYLVIISASDHTGYTYLENYSVSEVNEHTLKALKMEFEQSCGDVVYMSRGCTTTIDLDILTSNFTPKDDKKVLEYIKKLEEKDDEEYAEYERLKAKFENKKIKE